MRIVALTLAALVFTASNASIAADPAPDPREAAIVDYGLLLSAPFDPTQKYPKASKAWLTIYADTLDKLRPIWSHGYVTGMNKLWPDVHPGYAIGADLKSVDEPCFLPPEHYAISESLRIAGHGQPSPAPTCLPAWLQRAGAAMASVSTLMDVSYTRGESDALDKVQHRLNAANSEPSEPVSGFANALLAGARAFAAHPLGPGPSQSVNCISNRVGSSTSTNCH
jgi:hypothetical protein